MDYTLLAIPGAALLRNVAGWLENALQDKKIQSYEWKQLIATVVRVSVVSVGVMFGFNLDPVTAAGLGIVADLGISSVKKAGTA